MTPSIVLLRATGNASGMCGDTATAATCGDTAPTRQHGDPITSNNNTDRYLHSAAADGALLCCECGAEVSGTVQLADKRHTSIHHISKHRHLDIS